MQTDLAPIPETVEPADSWARSGEALAQHYQIPGRIDQAELARLEAEFLARGGAIQQIPMGVSAEVTLFNNCPVQPSAVGRSPYSDAERNAHQAAKVRRRLAGDDEAVARIKAALPTVSTAQELCKACSMSPDKLERLLRDYLGDDAAAQPFRKLSKAQREAKVCAEYPALAAEHADYRCAHLLHVSYPELKRIVALYNLSAEAPRIINRRAA